MAVTAIDLAERVIVANSLRNCFRSLRFRCNCILESLSPQMNSQFYIEKDDNNDIQFGASISSESVDGESDYFVHLFSVKPLETASSQDAFYHFLQSLPVNWSNPLGIHLAQITADVLATVKSRLDLSQFRMSVNCDMCNSWLRPSDFDISANKQLPDGYYLDQLKLHEAEWVVNKWKFRSPRTIVTVNNLIQCGRAPVVRHVSSELPVGWCLGSQYGQIFMLNVEENHRRKGLSRAVIARTVEIFAELNIPTHAITEKDNSASNQLFNSLGWNKGDEVIWVSVHKI